MATHLLTPSPSPPPPAPSPALTVQINTTTKTKHTRLNRLIMQRLPLALPPYSSSPESFGRGIALFAQLYYVFETVWQDLLSSSIKCGSSNSHNARVLVFLSDLQRFDRTVRLKNDIQYISRRTGMVIEPILEARQQQMLDVIARSIREKPHILIAYAWILYMALFSGGRWIRETLATPGLEFWTGDQDGTRDGKYGVGSLDMPGFSFLSFDGDYDGEDAKALFKAQMAEADVFLTHQERQDVLQAAQELFDDCILLVGMLDRSLRQSRIPKRVYIILTWIVAVLVFMYGWKSFVPER